MFVRNMNMDTLLFFVFFVIFGLSLDMPLTRMAMKLCKGDKRAATIMVLSIAGLLAYILVKIIGPPLTDFFDAIFRIELQRT